MEFIQFYDLFNEVEHGNIKERERECIKLNVRVNIQMSAKKMNENNQ